MRKCRNKANNEVYHICCYECENKQTCSTNNCYSSQEKDFEYEDCFFFLDTDNIRIIKENTITCDD